METIHRHAIALAGKNIAPANPLNDGKQMPIHGIVKASPPSFKKVKKYKSFTLK